MAKRYWLEPAGGIIDTMGGCAKVAEILGMNRTSVWRWTQPKPRGSDGAIPEHEVQQRILEWSSANGNPITPNSFFLPVKKAA